DLPAPFGPMNATDWPAGISTLTPSTATISVVVRRNRRHRVSANVFLRSSISMRASMARVPHQEEKKERSRFGLGPSAPSDLDEVVWSLGSGSPLPRHHMRPYGVGAKSNGAHAAHTALRIRTPTRDIACSQAARFDSARLAFDCIRFSRIGRIGA